MKEKIKTVLKGLLISILLFVSFVVIINTSLFDEELKPEVKKIIQDVPMPIVEGNAYYAIMGLSASKEKDIVEVGNQLILRYIGNRNNGNDAILKEDYNEILGTVNSHALEINKVVTPCEKQTEINCLNKISTNINNQEISNPRLQTYLQRYDEITNMKIYSPFIDTTMFTPIISYSLVTKLSQIKIALAYQKQNRAGFLIHLHKDQMFWKMILNQGIYLIDKMVAVEVMRVNINYLSEYMKKNQLENFDHQMIKEILSPLNSNELDLSASFISEGRSILKLIQSLESKSTWYEKLQFQPNATSNLLYKKMIFKLVEKAKLPIQELIKVRYSDNDNTDLGLNLNYLYNYLGKTLVKYSIGGYTDYMVRGHDLNNLIKMVNIQYQAKTLEQKTLHQLLLLPENVNAYNNKPFEYNENSKLLKFNCLDNLRDCKIKL